MWVFVNVLLIVALLPLTQCFTWHLLEEVYANSVLTYSEQFMFGSHHGPFMLPQHKSTIDSQLRVQAEFPQNTTTSFVTYGVYDTSFRYKESPLIGMCGFDPTIDLSDNSWAQKVRVERIPLQLSSPDPVSKDGNNVFLYSTDVQVSYEVIERGWYNVAMELCEFDSNGDASEYGADMSSMVISGEISFKNPYGYLPASLFGLLPYQTMLLALYLLTIVVFLWYFAKYSESIVSIHYGVLFVLCVAVTETFTWLLAYIYLNTTGAPYCCPFPVVIIVSLIFQIVRQAMSRTLLLVISLGYGIVRPKLQSIEWVGVSFITVMYFIAATVGQVFDIEIRKKLTMDSEANSENEIYIFFAEIFVDSVFITWIAFALTGTINQLKEYQQTYKLELYNRLYNAIIAFLIVFTVITVLISLNRVELVVWPWQLEWVPIILWPSFNFALLATVCVICVPTNASRYLAYSSQLPTFDPDASIVDEFNDTSSDVTGASEGLGFADEDGDILSGNHSGEKYDLMTPPVVRLLYKQQYSLTPQTNTKMTPQKYNVQINPLRGGSSTTPPQAMEGASDLAVLDDDEREFEMIMQGKKDESHESP